VRKVWSGRPTATGFSPVQPVTKPRVNETRVAAAPASDKLSTFLFYGYLTILLVEYCGLAKNLIPLLQAVRYSTVLAYVLLLITLTRAGDVLHYRQTRILLTLVFLTTASVTWAIVQTYAFLSIRPIIDYTIFFFLTLTLVDRRARIDALSWTFVAIAVYVVVQNVDALGSASRRVAFTAGYFMEDGNDLAWATVVMLPIILNLVFGQRSIVERLGGTIGVACCVVVIVGTGSRGSAIAAAAMALYYLVFLSRRKILAFIVMIGLGAAVFVAAPSSYVGRLESIAQYEEDNSALGRLQAWGAAIRMASTHPFGVGAGNFSTAYGRLFMPGDDDNRLAYAQRRWISAHSIYFKTTGEYGFLGLALLLWLLIGNLKDTIAIRKALAVAPETAPLPAIWPGLLGMSIVGHAICGAFLGGIEYPHLFILCGLTVASRRLAFGSVTASKQLVKADSRLKSR
jgi:probable O-glycosylation ligase (exosortase A-associated)